VNGKLWYYQDAAARYVPYVKITNKTIQPIETNKVKQETNGTANKIINTRRANQTWHTDQHKALQPDRHRTVLGRCQLQSSISHGASNRTVCLLWRTVRRLRFASKINILILGHDNRLNNSLLCLQLHRNRRKKWILVGVVRGFAVTWGQVNEVCFKGAVWDSYRRTDRHKMRRAYVRLWIFHVAHCGFQQTDNIHGSWIVMPH